MYDLVPKRMADNLDFRAWVYQRGFDDPDFAESCWIACSRDVRFYVNTFIWTVDPRRNDSARIPMITFEKQDEVLLEIEDCKGAYDLFIDKSRDMGISWCCLISLDFTWRFGKDRSTLMISRNESYVEDRSNPKALFSKLDFIEENMIHWMRPTTERAKLKKINHDRGNIINGESTTGHAGRGDRRYVIFLDEFSAFELKDSFAVIPAISLNCKSVIYTGTPQGTANGHYMKRQSDIRKIRVHWSDWPQKARGLYTYQNGERVHLDDYRGPVEMLDRKTGKVVEVLYPDEYTQFVADGKIRSPYYDNECIRDPIEAHIRAELDIDYLATGANCFDVGKLETMQQEFCMSPMARYRFLYDGDPPEHRGLHTDPNGTLSIWFDLVGNNKPPPSLYAIACDIGTGTGVTPSAAAIFDRRTRTKVGMLVTSYLRPEAFAECCVAMCKWFSDSTGNPALLGWEANGPGVQFGARVMEVGFGNIYYRTVSDVDDERKKVSRRPGWWSTTKSKAALLGEWMRAMVAGELTDRDWATLEEAKAYIYGPSGQMVHSACLTITDSSGASENHGDRVIASAVGWKLLQEFGTTEKNDPMARREVPQNSYQGRSEQYKRNLERIRESTPSWIRGRQHGKHHPLPH